jgi:hypothetical protein
MFSRSINYKKIYNNLIISGFCINLLNINSCAISDTKIENNKYYKLILNNHKYSEHNYKKGLNESFAFTDEKCIGPLQFSKLENVFKHISSPNNYSIAEVTLLDNSIIIPTYSSEILKTNRFILGEFQTFEDFFCINPHLRLPAVTQNGLMLKYIKDQTPEMCKAAVKQNAKALLYVNNKNSNFYIDLILEAAVHDDHTMYYVENQTEELCLKVARLNGMAIIGMKIISEKIIYEAIKQNGFVLGIVEQTTPRCLEAIKHHNIYFYISNKSPIIYFYNLKKNMQNYFKSLI